MSAGFDDLFDEAAESASQDTSADESWGAELKLAERERWAGRYLGEAVGTSFGQDQRIHLLEEVDGTATFMRGRTKLDQQFDKAKPAPGDVVAIVRLDDETTGTGNTMHRYGVAARKGQLPSGEPPATGSEDDLPF